MFNEEQVDETLKEFLKILKNHHVEYRFLDSVVTAAMIGSFHRHLGDLDLIIDQSKKDFVFVNKVGSGL